jgi:hypothetical protein
MKTAEEYWETHVYVMLGLQCNECGEDFECESCWNGVAPGEKGAERFASKVVKLARSAGWSLEFDPNEPRFLCPGCTAARRIA